MGNTYAFEQLGKLLSAVDVQFLIRLSEIIVHRIDGNAGILGDLLYGHAVGIFQDRLVFLYGKSVGAKRPLAGVDVNGRLILRLLAVKKSFVVAIKLKRDQLGKGRLNAFGTCLGVARQQKHVLRCHADPPCEFCLADLSIFNNPV